MIIPKILRDFEFFTLGLPDRSTFFIFLLEGFTFFHEVLLNTAVYDVSLIRSLSSMSPVSAHGFM